MNTMTLKETIVKVLKTNVPKADKNQRDPDSKVCEIAPDMALVGVAIYTHGYNPRVGSMLLFLVKAGGEYQKLGAPEIIFEKRYEYFRLKRFEIVENGSSVITLGLLTASLNKNAVDVSIRFHKEVFPNKGLPHGELMREGFSETFEINKGWEEIP